MKNEWKELDIAPGSKVLEIGSGGFPHPRSTVLLDKDAGPSHQRQGMSLARAGREVVIADAHELPFPDKSFDYVICSHVLEHVDDPVKVCGEMQRVAPRGFIEVPSELASFLFDPPDDSIDPHLWYVLSNGGELLFRRKTRELKLFRFHGIFTHWHRNDKWFQRLMLENMKLFYIQHEWRDTIPIRIVDDFEWDGQFYEEPADEWFLKYAGSDGFYKNADKHWLPDRTKLTWRIKEWIRRICRLTP